MALKQGSTLWRTAGRDGEAGTLLQLRLLPGSSGCINTTHLQLKETFLFTTVPAGISVREAPVGAARSWHARLFHCFTTFQRDKVGSWQLLWFSGHFWKIPASYGPLEQRAVRAMWRVLGRTNGDVWSDWSFSFRGSVQDKFPCDYGY